MEHHVHAHRLLRSSRAVRPLLWIWFAALGLVLAALGAAFLGGWRLDVVTSDSMAPELPKDSLAVTSPVRARAVQKDDVVAFRDPLDRSHIVLHRVIKVVGRGENLAFRTQGDANAKPDPVLVPAADLRSRLRFHVPRLGAAVRVASSPVGKAVILGVPALILLFGEFMRMRKRRTAEPAIAGS
jgi:signal peptidase